MDILVTGVAGFIGMHVARRLLENGHHVVGVDNLNDYYDVNLKKDRVMNLTDYSSFKFLHLDLTDQSAVESLFNLVAFSHVIHLAAQPGVRYSLENPHSYVMNNVVGFANVLEGCRQHSVAHLVYASSSSVYGMNRQMPFDEHHPTDHPLSLYAATKKSNELFAHTYSHLYQLPTTGLRFFTVYGPWGRPDMAPILFADAIMKGRPIQVFNEGRMYRDFTYIDDIAESILRLLPHAPAANPQFDVAHPTPDCSSAPYRIYNIGNQQPVELRVFIETLEDALGREAEKIMKPMQPGDMQATYADVQDLQQVIQWAPATPLMEGIARFADWFKTYYPAGTAARQALHA